MSNNEFFNLIAFCILMENNEGILCKSPDYILEKFSRYVGNENDEYKWGLDDINTQKLDDYLLKWVNQISLKVGGEE